MGTLILVGLGIGALIVIAFVAMAAMGKPSQARERRSSPYRPPSAGFDEQTSQRPRAGDPAADPQSVRIREAQERIGAMVFDPSIERQVRVRYPHLSPTQVDRVLDGLRQWFEVCALVDLAPLSMPSQGVDEAWHAFICSTERYREFCAAIFGRYLDHQPPEVLGGEARATQERDARTWVAACAVEGIDPRTPDRLPLLYAIDAEVAIPGGKSYDLAGRASLVASPTAAAALVLPSAPMGAGGQLQAPTRAVQGQASAMAGDPSPTPPAMGNGMDWMTSWLLWRTLLEPSPVALSEPDVWGRRREDDTADGTASTGAPTWSSTDGQDAHAGHLQHGAPAGPSVDDSTPASSGCGTPASDGGGSGDGGGSSDGGGASGCGGGSSCGGGGGD